MTVLRCLAVATMLTLSAQSARACDDFDEEMAMAGAYDAARLAQSKAPQAVAAERTAAPSSGSRAGVASANVNEAAATAQR